MDDIQARHTRTWQTACEQSQAIAGNCLRERKSSQKNGFLYRSGPIFHAGQWFSSHDKTLVLKGSAREVGEDGIGRYNSTALTWTGGTTQFQTRLG